MVDQWCPNVDRDDAFKSLNMLQKVAYFLGLDLNIDSASRTVTTVPAAESLDASRPARVFAVDAPSSADDVPPLRGSLCRGTQGQELLVPRSISVHGLRAADLPRESAGYRGEPSSPSGEALPFGDSRQRLSQHSGQCQRDPRLAYLRELRRALDRHRTRLVCRGTLRRGFGPDGLCARCDDDRSVFVGLSLGAVSFDEGRRQAAHVARSARQYPELYSHLRRQNARCQRARFALARAGSLLRDGSRLPRLRAAVPPARSGQLLRHASQVEPESRAPLFPSGGSSYGFDVRSNGDLEWVLFAQRVSRSAPSHQVHRSEDPQAPRILDQSVRLARFEHRRLISLPLAGGAFLQMDQAAPADQGVLRNFRKRGEDTNLDRHLGLRPRRHRQEAAEPAAIAL